MYNNSKVMIKIKCFIFLFFTGLSFYISAQDTLLLNEPDSGLRYYCANTRIVFNSGYSFYSNESERMHAYISEMCAISYPETPEKLGSIKLSPDFGTYPYYYFWSDGDQSSYRTGLESGIYAVNVVDTLGDTTALSIPVGMEIQWDSIDSVTIEYDVLQKTGNDGWGNGLVALNNIVNTAGEIRIEVTELSSKWTFGYTLSSNDQAEEYSDMDFALYIDETNKLYSYENSTLTYLTTVVEEDILSIELVGDQVLFKKNDVSFRQVNYNPSNEYRMDFSLYTSKMKLGPIIIINFPFWPKLSEEITHISCYGGEGKIEMNLVSGVRPIGYLWSGPNSFSASTQDIVVTEPGIYELIVNVGIFSMPPKYYVVGYDVNWSNLNSVTVTGSSLTNSYGSDGYNLSGASSSNLLESGQSGWLEFKVSLNSILNNQVVGLSNSDQDLSGNSVEFGLKFLTLLLPLPWATFYLRLVGVIESGSTQGWYSSFNSSDRFKIEYDNSLGKVFYYKNPSVNPNSPTSPFHTTSVSPQNFIVDADLSQDGEGITSAIVSFPCPGENYVYGHLKKKLEGGIYRAVDNKVYLKYTEEYNSNDFQFKIYDDSNNLMADESTLIVTTFSGYGDNRLEIDLIGAGVVLSSGYYVLEVINDKNETWFLRFKY